MIRRPALVIPFFAITFDSFPSIIANQRNVEKLKSKTIPSFCGIYRLSSSGERRESRITDPEALRDGRIDGGLSHDGFRVGWIAATPASGQKRSWQRRDRP
jgi:hypothetical protein